MSFADSNYSQQNNSFSNTQNGHVANSAGDKPVWLNNPKKRIIPNHLILKKKTGFLKSNDNTDYNSISFGNSSSTTPDTNQTSSKNLITSNLSILNSSNSNLALNDDDLPPTNSIYDLADDDNEQTSKTQNQDEIWNNSNSFINKDPKNFNNIFKRNMNESERIDDQSDLTINNSINPVNNGESAILVFGYPESMSNQVISHFANFGNILEDFDIIRSKKNSGNYYTNRTKNIPIFIGDSWLKITYDNPSSAIRAIEENGSFFNGTLLGVVQYTKNSIEKLQKRKLGDEEDIGNGSINYQNYQNNQHQNEILNYEAKDANNFNIIELKDGSNFFKTPVEKIVQKDDINELNNDKNTSFFTKITNFIFGFNEL